MKMEARVRFLAKMVDIGKISEDALPEKYKEAVIAYRAATNTPEE